MDNSRFIKRENATNGLSTLWWIRRQEPLPWITNAIKVTKSFWLERFCFRIPKRFELHVLFLINEWDITAFLWLWLVVDKGTNKYLGVTNVSAQHKCCIRGVQVLLIENCLPESVLQLLNLFAKNDSNRSSLGMLWKSN